MKLPLLTSKANASYDLVRPLKKEFNLTSNKKLAAKNQILVINCNDITEKIAERIIDTKPAFVINLTSTISSAYPSYGINKILTANIPIMDEVNPDALVSLKNGTKLQLSENKVFLKNELLFTGNLLTKDLIENRLATAEKRFITKVETLTGNIVEHLYRRLSTFIENLNVPDLSRIVAGRYIVVVAEDYTKAQLKALKPFIKEYQPIFLAVETAADKLLDEGITPEIVFTSAINLTYKVIQTGAHLVILADENGQIPNIIKIRDQLLQDALVFPDYETKATLSAGLLIAETSQSPLIVLLGKEFEFKDYFVKQSEADFVPLILAKLKLGTKLVHGDKIASLYKSQMSLTLFGLFIFTVLLVTTVVLLLTTKDITILENIRHWFSSVFNRNKS